MQRVYVTFAFSGAPTGSSYETEVFAYFELKKPRKENEGCNGDDTIALSNSQYQTKIKIPVLIRPKRSDEEKAADPDYNQNQIGDIKITDLDDRNNQVATRMDYNTEYVFAIKTSDLDVKSVTAEIGGKVITIEEGTFKGDYDTDKFTPSSLSLPINQDVEIKVIVTPKTGDPIPKTRTLTITQTCGPDLDGKKGTCGKSECPGNQINEPQYAPNADKCGAGEYCCKS